MKTNCLAYAWRRWWETRKQRTYFCMRLSDRGPFPHFLFLRAEGEQFEHYVPRNPQDRIIPPIRFDGYVKQGDKKQDGLEVRRPR